MSSDFFEKHVSAISATCFFHLRQIRRVQQSLDVGLAKTVVQAFVTSRVNYCNGVLAESPRVITDKLQRVMNSAAHVVTDTWKYDSGLSRLMHDELHWLDVTDRVRFKLAVLMYRCLQGTAQTVFVTQNWVSILSNVSWRHTFLRNIDDKMYSAH